MCLIFLAINKHPKYKLIVAANRDEFYNRKTAGADFWEDHPEILGGRDLEAGGSWMAMNTTGKIAMVTNYRDLHNLKSVAPSRGHLVSDFLKDDSDVESYLKSIELTAKEYNGFNLIVADKDKIGYLSNYKEGIEILSDGIYGLSNGLLDSNWPKVIRGKEKFIAKLQGNVTTAELFDVLLDEERAPDDQLPKTGLDIERERAVSAIFIKSPGYGSRCSTVVLVDYNDQVEFTERVYDLESFAYTTSKFEFSI
jgi:uncharacterized protein with NRDE domain